MKKYFLMFLYLGCSLLSTLDAQNDATDCEDHPLISRYPAAQIDWCDTQVFMEYHVAIGPQTGYRKIDDWIDVEGKTSRIYYSIKGGATVSDIYQNYRNAFQRDRIEILAKGLNAQRNVSKEVGGRTWLGTAYSRNPLPSIGTINLFHGSASSGGAGYLAGKLERTTGNVYLVLMVYQYKAEEVVVQLDVIEEAPLDDGKITLDLDYISRQLETNGAVTLEGIYFDFEKTTIQPASKKTLDLLAEFLTKHPDFTFYVVGHTDMKGSLAYNQNLSNARAQAVVDSLTKDYGIAEERLEAQGVGLLVPKSNNISEEGRQLNRRVELVQKLKTK